MTAIYSFHTRDGAASLSQDEFRAFTSKTARKKAAKKRPPAARVSLLRSAIRRIVEV